MKQSHPFERVKQLLQDSREVQLFYKCFLKPMEIALKTSESQMEKGKNGVHPYGLKQIFKMTIDDNKLVMMDFQPIDSALLKAKDKLSQKLTYIDYDIDKVKSVNCDNMISLLKPESGKKKIKVAICICLQKQSKVNLKKTLNAVAENIKTFVKDGLHYNQIAVIIIIDGIEQVHPSIIKYFEQLQKDYNLFLDQQEKATNLRQIQRQIDDEEVLNLKSIIFDEQELVQLKKRRFIQRKRQYQNMKRLIQKIELMEKEKHLLYYNLDSIIQKFFIEIAKKQWKTEFAIDERQIGDSDNEKIAQYYAESHKRSEPIIRQALAQAKKYCIQYINARNNLGLLNSYRIDIGSIEQQTTKKQQNSRSSTNSQIQDNGLKMNLFFLTKYQSKGKFSTFDWFFNGFCQELQPQYGIILDAGIQPSKKTLYEYVSHMDKNPKVGGVYGNTLLKIDRISEDEMSQYEQNCCTSFFKGFFDIKKAQIFQYYYSNLVNKPFQTSFCSRYIHQSLPHCCAGFRIRSLCYNQQNEEEQSKFQRTEIEPESLIPNPYSKSQVVCKVISPQLFYNLIYSKPLNNSFQKQLITSNLQQIESKVLQLKVFQNREVFSYLPDTNIYLQPQEDLIDFLEQRKKWINGVQSAKQQLKYSIYSATTFQSQINSLIERFLFIFPALFMYIFHSAMYTFQVNVINYIIDKLQMIQTIDYTYSMVTHLFVYLMDLIFLIIFFRLVIYSVYTSNWSKGNRGFYYGLSIAYGCFFLMIIGVILFDIISGLGNGHPKFLVDKIIGDGFQFYNILVDDNLIISILRYMAIGLSFLYIFPILTYAILCCQFHHIFEIFFSTLPYIFYIPTYAIITPLYALASLDHVDTKKMLKNFEQNEGIVNKMKNEWKSLKIIGVLKYVIYNVVLASVLISIGNNYVIRFWIIFGIIAIVLILQGIKVLCSTFELIKYKACSSLPSKQNIFGINTKDQIQEKFNSIKQSIYHEIKDLIEGSKQFKQGVSPVQFVSMILGSNINGAKKGRKPIKLKKIEKIYNFAKFSQIQTKFKFKTIRRIEEIENGKDDKSGKSFQPSSFHSINGLTKKLQK